MKKDWKGTLRNVEILPAMVILPVVITNVLPVILLVMIPINTEHFLSEYPGMADIIVSLNISHLSPQLQAAKFAIKWMIIPFFLYIPGFTSSIIAADSFAGEKERKTMENVVLLPITKLELIIGKVMTSFIPSLFIVVTCFFGLGLLTNLIFFPYLNGNVLIFMDLGNLLIGFLLSPLISFPFILINPFSLIFPIIAISSVQMINPSFFSQLVILIIASIFGILSIVFVRLAIKLLDIERLILTI